MLSPDQLQELKDAVTNAVAASQSPWLDITGAAEYAKCSEQCVLNAVNAGHVTRYSATGTRISRFRRDDLDRWLSGKAKRK